MSVTFTLLPELLDSAIASRVVTATQRANTAIEVIDAKDIEVTIGIDKEQVIPETGVGGSTETVNLIHVWIDDTHENVEANVEEEVCGSITHELHHAMRNRVYPWPGTLLDNIVGEGLADHFDIEINGQRYKPWTEALSDEQLQDYYLLAKPHFGKRSSQEEYYKWIFGFGSEEIPPWAGYSYAFKMVGEYITRTGKKPSELVHESSTSFLPLGN